LNAIDLDWFRNRATVVLEGCDGAGKTTLANLLEERHGFTVIHSPRSPDSVDLSARYRSILRRRGRLVLDRSFVSELVYSQVFGRDSRLTVGQVLSLAEAVADRDGLFVHVHAQAGLIERRLRQRDGPTALDLLTIEKIQAAYEQALSQISVHVPVVGVSTDHDQDA
jgi:hypothetical protein